MVLPTVPPLKRKRGKSRRPFRTTLACELLEDRAVPTASITGIVFDDVDGNGQQDVGEGGISAATVYLDQNGNGILDGGETTTTTDGNGAYTFSDLAPGTYSVRLVLSAGEAQTSPGPVSGPDLLGQVQSAFSSPALYSVGTSWKDGFLYQLDRGNPSDFNDGVLFEFDPATGVGTSVLTLTGDLAGDIVDLTHDGTYFWGLDWFDGTGDRLVQFDAAGNVMQTFVTANQTRGIVWDGTGGENTLWVIDSLAGRIRRLDLDAGLDELASFATPATTLFGLEFDGHYLWTNDRVTSTTYQLDAATGEVVRSFTTPYADSPSATGIAFGDGSLWITQRLDGEILRVDTGLPAAQLVTVADGETASDVDFGRYALGTASGTVFDDADGDGVGDPGEAGLEGWRIFVDLNGNGTFERYENSALSDENGVYQIAGLLPGTPPLRQVLRSPGWVPTASGTDFGNRLDSVGPIGREILVNTTVEGIQGDTIPINPGRGAVTNTDTAIDAQGNFVVVWDGQGAGDDAGVFFRRFAADGSPLGDEVLVNTSTADVQHYPVVARAPTGQFVVGWTSRNVDADPTGFFRLYDADGTPRTGPIQFSGSGSWITDVAMAADGRFAVLYSVPSTTGGFGGDIRVQRYDALGNAQGPGIRVADPNLGNGRMSLAMDASGGFVVVWDESNNGRQFIYAQRYKSSGKTAGNVIQVNADTSADSTQWQSNVVMDAQGNFAVSWQSLPVDRRVLQIVNADGTLRGAPLLFGQAGQVSGAESQASMSLGTDGELAIAWTYLRLNHPGEINAQRFRITTTGVEAIDLEPFLVNTTLEGRQVGAAIALAGNGNFVVAWRGNGIGDDQGIFAQVHAGPAGPYDPAPTITSFTDSPDPVFQGETLTLTATVAAGEGTVVSVAFYRDANGDGTPQPGELLGTDTIGSDGWSVTVSIPADFPTGTYTYFAQATDGTLTSAVASTTGEVARKKGGRPKLVAATVGAGGEMESLTISQVQPLLAEAVRRFAAAGVDVSGLSNLQVHIADLPGATLGQAAGNALWIDEDAAGWGWFLDGTPADDLEFLLDGDQGEQGKMDLLTVLAHEIGHLLGFDHDDAGMTADLAPGTRVLPSTNDVLILEGGETRRKRR